MKTIAVQWDLDSKRLLLFGESGKFCLHTRNALHPLWLQTWYNRYLLLQLDHYNNKIKFNPFTEFMSFSPDLRAIRNGKINSTISHPKMSVSAENTTDTSAPRNPEHIEESNNGLLHQLINERIKANLGPLKEQIPTLTQLLNHLIQESPARNPPTADIRTQQTQARRSPSHESKTSRASLAGLIGNTGSLPDSRYFYNTIFTAKIQWPGGRGRDRLFRIVFSNAQRS